MRELTTQEQLPATPAQLNILQKIFGYNFNRSGLTQAGAGILIRTYGYKKKKRKGKK